MKNIRIYYVKIAIDKRNLVTWRHILLQPFPYLIIHLRVQCKSKNVKKIVKNQSIHEKDYDCRCYHNKIVWLFSFNLQAVSIREITSSYNSFHTDL